MKYLVAVKPCGCIGSWIFEAPNSPGRLEDFRAFYEREGAIVRESESPPPFIFRKDCPHGSLPAQLAAKVREMEAREAGLKKWLRERIWEVQDYDGNAPLVDQFYGKLEAFREVLTKLEGNWTLSSGKWERVAPANDTGRREGSKP